MISFKLGMMLVSFTFLCQLYDFDLHYSCMWNKKTLVSIFSQISVNFDEIQMTHSVGLWKLMLNLFCTSVIQVREFCWRDFKKSAFNIVLCQDTCELICCNLGLMLNTAKLYSLIPVWMTLMFALDHRVTGKFKLVQSFHCKVAWRNSNVLDGWLGKGDDCEEVL